MSEWIMSAEDIDDITGGRFTVGQKLVRCKDCKNFHELHDRIGVCRRDKRRDYYEICGIINGEWFCADGERLEDDDLPMWANHNGERREEDETD